MKIISKLFSGLKGKIQAVFLIVFMLAALLFTGTIYFTLRPELVARYQQELKGNTDVVANLVQMHIATTIQNYLDTIAMRMYQSAEYYHGQGQRGAMTPDVAYGAFKRMMLDPEFGKVGETGYLAGISSKGMALIHPKIEGRDLSGYDFMKKAIEMKNGYLEYDWANPGEKEKRKKVGSLLYYKPWDVIIWVSSYRDEFVRFVDQADIRMIIEKVRIGKGGYSIIVNSKGSPIGLEGKAKEFIEGQFAKDYGKKILAWARTNPGLSRVDVIPAGFKNGEEGKIFYAGYRFIPELDWVLVTIISEDEATHSINTILMAVAFIVVIGIIAIALITGGIFTRILKPVDEVRKVSDAISAGDLTKRADVKSKDEIGQMSVQFNVIINNFSTLLRDIKNTSGILLDSVQDLSSSAQEIATTSNQQAAAVKEIVSTMEDSDNLSKSIAVKIEEVTRVSVNTREIVDNGFAIIKDSLAKMDEIKSANAETIQGIKLLGEKIDSIWDIVNIINGIADQTKIIAFNAELEASAAGEAGKNFQIVATEIRRLADNTVSSTNEIKAKINEIQHSSDRLIIASEEGTGKIKQGWELSDGLRRHFDDILRSSEISVRSAEQISVSIKQQVGAFEQILLTLKQISEGIDNFVISTRSMTSSSEGLKNQAGRLTEVVGQYKVGGEGIHG